MCFTYRAAGDALFPFQERCSMRMLVEFDVDADIIDVPQYVIDDRLRYRNQFYKWLSDPSVKHKYWRTYKSQDGSNYVCLCYRSEAFVEWLNKKLRKAGDNVCVVQTHVAIDDYRDTLPSIFF